MEKDENKKTDMEQELEALYLKVASLDSSGNILEEEKESKEPAKTHEILKLQYSSEDAPAQERKKSTFRFLRIAPMLGIFTFLLILVAIFLWPISYNYYAIYFGDKVYPLKTNNLTSEAEHFDGKGKLQTPLPSDVTKNVTSAADTQITGAQLANQDQLQDQTEILFSLPPPNTTKRGKYAIQVKAYPEAKKKDAIMFVESLKRGQFDIHVEKVHIPGRGDWYRILFGHFASSEEASNYIKEKKIFHAYPDCFVQVKSEG